MSVYIFIFFACFTLDAQVFTPLDSLFYSLECFYEEKLEASSLEFEKVNKYKALNYLPSVGYDFLNHSPILTYNIGSLSRYLNNNQSLKFRQQSIEKTVALELSQVRKIVETNYLKLLDLFYSYSIDNEIYNLHMKLYNLDLKKYENHEIPLEIFIQKQIEIKEKEKSLYSMKEKIFHAVLELEHLTNYHLNYEIKSFISVNCNSIH